MPSSKREIQGTCEGKKAGLGKSAVYCMGLGDNKLAGRDKLNSVVGNHDINSGGWFQASKKIG